MTNFWIALSIVVFLLILLAFSIARRFKQSNLRIEQLESRLQSQQASINGLTAGAIGVDKRLRGIEDREKAIVDRQETIESQQSQTEAPFGEAIRLVQQGASAQRLVDELGLSQSEASLIAMIHGSHNN